jgi:2-C-methyl-D-erythritol 4-phosphate cytidylyltransferase
MGSISRGADGPIWAVVVAAGSGERFGAPKQYELVAGRRVLDWSLDAARSVAAGIVLVVTPGREGVPEPGADVVVAGGDTRSASVRAGLVAVPEGAGVIVVHDAARPAATPALFTAAVLAVRAGADAAVPGVPLVDSVKRVVDGVVVNTIERRGLVAVQTPQAFLASALRAAHDGANDATDDAALVEAAGGRVVVVPGEPDNLKLTSRSDLDRLGSILA